MQLSTSVSLPDSPRPSQRIPDLKPRSQSLPSSRHASRPTSPRHAPRRHPLDFQVLPRHSFSSLKTSGAATFGRQARPTTPAGKLELSRSGLMSSTNTNASLCSVHSFSTLPTYKPSPGAATWPKGNTPSRPAVHGPEVHSYLGPSSTLSRSGISAFGTSASEREEGRAPLCPVHSYASLPRFTPSAGAASFGREKVSTRPRTSGPDVHAYASQRSSLSRSGASAFAKDSTSTASLALTAASAYQAPSTTLNRSGVSAFGRQPARPEHFASKRMLSRSGLMASSGSGGSAGLALPPLPVRRAAPAA
jgi:hypothetical protein